MSWRCWLRRVARDDLLREARASPLRETGGALLGWREESNYVIDRVLGPGPNAKHRFSSFEPDAEWQAREGARIYAATARTVAYLGDWHTHPHGSPWPSGQDRRTVRVMAEDPDFRISRPLYAIAGRGIRDRASRRWRLVIYVWDGDKLVELEPELI